VRRAVWLALLWVLVSVAFPEVREALPPQLLAMTYAVAVALILTAPRDYLSLFARAFAVALASPLSLLYTLFSKLGERLWRSRRR